ncbi:hypothetical protein [Salana multivorans]
MTNQPERMSLPASDAPLHPLDIREARGYYLAATLLRLFVSPTVLVASVLLLWVVSNNSVTPVLGPSIGLTLIAYVERKYRSDAWSYIPRRQQDVGRDEPASLALLARGVEVAVLAVATASFVSSVGIRLVPTRVTSIAVGIMLGLALIVVATLLWDRSAPRDHRFSLAPSLVGNVAAGSILLVVAWGTANLMGRVALDMPTTLIGFAVVGSVTTLWLLLRLIPVRVRCLPASINI